MPSSDTSLEQKQTDDLVAGAFLPPTEKGCPTVPGVRDVMQYTSSRHKQQLIN